MNLLRNSEQLAAQQYRTDTLVSYDETLVSTLINNQIRFSEFFSECYNASSRAVYSVKVVAILYPSPWCYVMCDNHGEREGKWRTD